MFRHQLHLCFLFSSLAFAEEMLKPKMVVPLRRGPASLRDVDKKPKPKRSLRNPTVDDSDAGPSDLDPNDGKPVRVTEYPEDGEPPHHARSFDESVANLAVTANLMSMYYVEEIAPPVDGEDGFLPGVNVDFLAYLGGRWMIRGLIDFDFGKTQYFGALTNGTPISSPTNVVILDLAAEVGYSLLHSPTYRITPFVGFGHHYWNRGLTGIGSYLERYYFIYLPVGVRYDQTLSEDFLIAVDLTFYLNLGGHIDVYFSQLVPPQQDATGTLGKSSGIRIQAPIDYKLTDNFTLRLVPFFEYFGIGKGDEFVTKDANGVPTGTAHEPASSTTLYGARLGGTLTF